jgi:hypothetical protein
LGNQLLNFLINDSYRVLFFQICDVTTLSIIELTKFGYRWERKAEKYKKPAVFWQQFVGTYCINMATLALFFHRNPFYEQWATLHFCMLPSCKNSQKKIKMKKADC